LYAGRNVIRVQFRVKCCNAWVVDVVVVVAGGIKICNVMLTMQTRHVFLISVSG
jgi:hypothetical protein